MSDLKPCPFCGEPTMHHIFTMVPDDQEAQLYTQITCERCKASISKDSRSAAIAGWNRRLSYKRLKPEEAIASIEGVPVWSE